MGLCPPAVTAAALFTALTVIDTITKKYNELPYDILGGFFSTLALYVICERIGDFAGWMLLGIPIAVVVVAGIVMWIQSMQSVPKNEKCEDSQIDSYCEDDLAPSGLTRNLNAVVTLPLTPAPSGWMLTPVNTSDSTPAPTDTGDSESTIISTPTPTPTPTPRPIGGPAWRIAAARRRAAAVTPISPTTPTPPTPDGVPTTCLPPPVNANWWWGR